MSRRNVFITVIAAAACLAVGYFMALPRPKTAAPGNGIAVDVISIRDVSSNELYRVTGEYPQFENISADLNGGIADFVNATLDQFKSDAEANDNARSATMPTGTRDVLPPQSFYFSSSWEPRQVNDHYISIIVRLSYFNGGANATQLLATFNYDVAAKRIMSLGDLFPNTPDYLKRIARFALEQLQDSLTNAAQTPLDSFSLGLLESGTDPTADNYANFTFNDDVVNIYFPKYQVAPGVFGEQKIGVIRSAIQ